MVSPDGGRVSPFGAGSRRKLPPTAAKFLGLFDELQTAEVEGGKPHMASQRTDAEINHYTRYGLRTTPRPGPDSLPVKIFPQN